MSLEGIGAIVAIALAIAGGVTSWVSAHGKTKVDTVAVGLKSLTAALARSDLDRDELTAEVRQVREDAEKQRVQCERDTRELRTEVATLSRRLTTESEAGREREEACNERVRVLVRELQQLRGG